MNQNSYKFKYSVVIPCFNSPNSLANLVKKLSAELANRTFEIILVCDGPDQELWKRIEKIVSGTSNTKGILLEKRSGQHAAIFAGISVSKYQNIITLDDDGQHTVDSINVLIAEYEKGASVVYGHPIQDEHTFFRNFYSRSSKIILEKFLNLPSARKYSALRVFNKTIIENLDSNFNQLIPGTLDTTLNNLTSKVQVANVIMEKRSEGKSNYNLTRLIKYAMSLSLSSSLRPLRFATILGAIGFVVAFSGSIAIFFLALTSNKEVPGYFSLQLSIMFFASIQLLCVGILGEYIGVILRKIMGTRYFYISEEIGSDRRLVDND